MFNFQIDKEYTKRDIYRVIGLPENTHGGNWDTGYNKFNDDYFIFANINVPGRTGHEYRNKFDGDLFQWYAKRNRAVNTPEIQNLLNPTGYVYIFYRFDNRNPFVFAGTGLPVDFTETSPVMIIWRIDNIDSEEKFSNVEVQTLPLNIREGARAKRVVNIYERNPEARKRCIAKHGYICSICGFNFKRVYGEIGEEFIHVHHLIPLSI